MEGGRPCSRPHCRRFAPGGGPVGCSAGGRRPARRPLSYAENAPYEGTPLAERSAREPPALDTPATRTSSTLAAQSGGSRALQRPERHGVRERHRPSTLILNSPRAASRTPPRPRRGTAAERDSSPADWQDEQASAASAHGNAATNWSLLAPALIAPVRDFSFRTLSTEFLV